MSRSNEVIMYEALVTDRLVEASPSLTDLTILSVPSTVLRVGERIAPSAFIPANLRVIGESEAMKSGILLVGLKPSSRSFTVKKSPVKLTFPPAQIALRRWTYSLILFSGLVSLTGKILWPINGIVGKLPRASPRIALPPESSLRDAKVVASVTGCLVLVFTAPDP